MRNRIGISIIIVSLVLLPFALFFKSVVKNTLSEKSLKTILKQQVFDSNNLSRLSRAIVNEKAIEAKDMRSAMMMAIFSKATTKKWEEFYSLALPIETSAPWIDKVCKELFIWLDNDEPYPAIEIQTTAFIENIKQNRTKLFSWAHQIMDPPQVSKSELESLVEKKFGNSLPDLLMTGVPDSLENRLFDKGGDLMLVQLENATIPLEINTNEILSEKISVERISTIKSKINKILKFANLWILLIILLSAGLLLCFKNKRYLLRLSEKTTYFTGFWLFITGWMFTNYLFINLEIKINESQAPRGVRDLIIEILSNTFVQGSQLLYISGLILLCIAMILSFIKYVFKNRLS